MIGKRTMRQALNFVDGLTMILIDGKSLNIDMSLNLKSNNKISKISTLP